MNAGGRSQAPCDRCAATLLSARRIIEEAEDTRLRGLLAEAARLADAPVAIAPAPAVRQKIARELDAWLRDWRETARVLVTRRDYQIQLGLAERRASSASAAAVVEGA